MGCYIWYIRCTKCNSPPINRLTNHRIAVSPIMVRCSAVLMCQCTDTMVNKKLSYCWNSSRYDKISASGRSANPNRNPDSLNMTWALCQFNFVNRVVNTWNSVPSHVASANTLSCFESRLEIASNQPVIRSNNTFIIIFVQKFKEPEADAKWQTILLLV